LHHYDDIDLLKPSYIGKNGYRYYERAALLRLQQVLFYRTFDMPLAEIKATLDDPAFSAEEALLGHRKRLHSKIVNYRQLICTIDETLSELRGEKEMENPFNGFDPEKQKDYERELLAQADDQIRAHLAQSKARVAKMSKADIKAINEDGHKVHLELTKCLTDGAAPGDREVQQLIAAHYRWVCHYWTPDREAYIGLSENYVGTQDFRVFYGKYHEGLVDFLAAGMKIYAEVNL
jgi:DNA-binding transcriptional MerR regulator